MKSALPEHLQTIVDSICEQGCSDVNHTIDKLQQGETDELTQPLNRSEQQAVLHELQCIMAVYNKKH